MKIDRLLSIIVLLLGRERVKAEVLSRRFEVSVRTIYRDLDAINASGIPVVAYSGPGGGYCIDPSYTIDRRLLGFDDLRAIVSALKGVQTALGDKAIGSALEKLESLGPRDKPTELLEERIAIDLFPWGRREEEKRLVQALEPAIAERRLVSFAYSSYGGKVEKRVVEPMTLVFKAYAWYLWGFCRLRGDYRLFKLSRIRELSTSLERFKRRPDSYTPGAEIPKSPDVDILLRIDHARASEAWEWFSVNFLEPEEDGRIKVAFRVPAGDWVVRTLLGFGPGVEVLEPEPLRRAVSEAAAGIAAVNSSSSGPSRQAGRS